MDKIAKVPREDVQLWPEQPDPACRQSGVSSSGDEVNSQAKVGIIPVLLTPVEAAAALGVCRTKLYELMGAGDLAYVRIGRSRRVPVVALHQFVVRQMQRHGFQP